MARITEPLCVPQSSSVTTRSCVTSHQTARQVTGVGRFQRRVGQTLTGTVGGDEVLQHVQAFAEVRRDRRFDDGAVRLGHQTAHTGHLANLRCGTAGARVGHHVDGVERFLLDFLAVAVDDLFLGQLGHHDLGDFVAGLAPDVHHLVVALAGGHQTGDILLLDLFDFLLGARNDAGFSLGTSMSSMQIEMPALASPGGNPTAAACRQTPPSLSVRTCGTRR